MNVTILVTLEFDEGAVTRYAADGVQDALEYERNYYLPGCRSISVTRSADLSKLLDPMAPVRLGPK